MAALCSEKWCVVEPTNGYRCDEVGEKINCITLHKRGKLECDARGAMQTGCGETCELYRH